MNEINYSLAGVDRKEREKAKKFGLFEKGFSGKVIRTPFNNLFPFPDSKDYYCFCADGVGTKVLLAQLAGKHDSIGIDGVAMVVNDAVRSGAKPVSLVNIIDAKKSNAEVLKELIEGINKGAKEAECTVAGGETADLGEMISGIGENAYHINFACIGTVKEKEIIKGDGLKKGDKVIGLRSNGLHSNGISLARRVLFKEWNGYYEKDAYSEELKGNILEEVLKPTKIYVKPVLKAMKEFRIKGAIHITGDAYLKFKKFISFNKGIGFNFTNFKPQAVFSFIQETAEKMDSRITEEEMFKTFNMGWGFGLITEKKEVEGIIKLLKKEGINAEEIGEVNSRKESITVERKGKEIELNK